MVESDQFDASAVHRALVSQHQVQTIDGPSALRFITTLHPDAVLVGSQSVKTQSPALLETLERDGHVPVVLVLERADELSSVADHNSVIVDYLIGSFEPLEAVFRLRRALHLPFSLADHSFTIHHGSLELDLRRKVTRINGNRVNLTGTEFQLLTHLARFAGEIYTRDQLADVVSPRSAKERIIDSHMSNLRAKLRVAGAPRLIETVRGEGYRLWSDAVAV